MPTPYDVPAFLRFVESSQSGTKTLTAAYAEMFEDSDTKPWLFARGTIDLSNMASLDVVHVKVSVVLESGGSYLVYDEMTFKGVQPAAKKVVILPSIPNVYGVKIEAYQSAGTLIDSEMVFYTAKR